VQKTTRAPRPPWKRLSPKFNRLLDDDSVSGVDDDDPMDVDNNVAYTQTGARPARTPPTVSADPRAGYAD
jgi:hypothetical protein